VERFKQFTLTNDEAWRLHDKDFDQFRAKFTEMVNSFPPIHESLDRIWKLQRAQTEIFHTQFMATLSEYDQPAEKVQPNGNGVKPLLNRP
jgi:hypothetical protein